MAGMVFPVKQEEMEVLLATEQAFLMRARWI
jgi:hypothetical protein